MILSGKELAKKICLQLSKTIEFLPSTPFLAVILLGENLGSLTYINMKRRACEKVKIRFIFHHLSTSTTELELLQLIDTLNHDIEIDGILVQLPLPRHIRATNVIQAIDPRKDVDGFHPLNLGKLLCGLDDGFIPCTPLGIKILLEYYKIPVERKHVVIIGRSTIVGKPLAALLVQKAFGCNATVTISHSKTENLAELTRQADVLVAAIGSARFVKADMVKQSATVIDIGINREEDSLVGDVDFENVERKCKAITPVPGGVGPLTVAMLLQNTVCSHQKKHCL